MRAFVALELSEEFATDIAGLARQLGEAVEARFMGRDSYHLTLAFLGEVDERELAQAIDAVEEACAGCPPIPLRAEGLGKFGRKSDATLWMGVAHSPQLDGLVECLRDGLEQRDVPFDDKAFKPHVTIARRARLPQGALPALAFPLDSEAAEVIVFKSTLTPEGARYKPLHTVKLER